MMLAKSGFVLRTLLVATFLGGLVACTFDQPSTEGDKEKESSSAIHTSKKGVDSGTEKGADASAGEYDSDGGINEGADACACNTGADGGTYGGQDASAGDWGADGGAYEGDDDDDLGVDGGTDWGTDGGAW